MINFLPWIGVAALGALGALARVRLGAGISARWPSVFPFGTLAVNLTGAFALGVLVGLGVAGNALLMLGAGLLGAFTTFSTWMVETQRLVGDGEWRLAWLNLIGPMVAGLAVTGLGWIVGGALG